MRNAARRPRHAHRLVALLSVLTLVVAGCSAGAGSAAGGTGGTSPSSPPGTGRAVGSSAPATTGTPTASASAQPAGNATPAAIPTALPNQPPITFQPGALAFWDASRGLMGGGYAHPDGSGTGVILATTDGGRHWKVVDSPAATVTQLWVAGSNAAWALTSCQLSAPPCAHLLLHSTNGGATWTSAPTDLAWVTFATPTSGWGAPPSNPGQGMLTRTAYHTTDGGKTWTAVTSPCHGSPIGPLRTLAFDTPASGLAICANTLGAGGEFHSVLATTDGGTTWHVRASVGAPPAASVGSLPYGGYIHGIVVASDGTAWLWGDRMVPLASSDNGATWRPLGIGVPDALTVTAAWPFDARQGAVLLWNPDRQATLVEVTGNGGATWTERSAWPVHATPGSTALP